MTSNFIPAPKDLCERYAKEHAAVDAITPFKLTVFPKEGLPINRRFAAKDVAMGAYHDEEDTTMLQDFSCKPPRIHIKYRRK